jgi:hypothetical protein
LNLFPKSSFADAPSSVIKKLSLLMDYQIRGAWYVRSQGTMTVSSIQLMPNPSGMECPRVL